MARIILAPVVVALMLSMNGCYLVKQGRYLLHYNLSARDITEVREAGTDPETAAFFDLIADVKRFAETTIGLNSNDNYTTYVDIKKDYIVDVLSACRKDRFEAHEWWFPVMGSFPYKGFYEREDAVEEAEKMKALGYDVSIRKVTAFSTLGFFTDPAFSFMKKYTACRLANLIIHEQTHATIFVKNNVQFNEELATFTGQEGAFLYIEKKFGKRSKEYIAARQKISDSIIFREYIHGLYNELVTLYTSDISGSEKISLRKTVFEKYQKRFACNYQRMFKTDTYRWFPSLELNNAFIMGWMTYTRDLGRFEKLYALCGRDLRVMISRLRGVEKAGDPGKYLAELISGKN